MYIPELVNTERWESSRNVKLRDGALVEIGFHTLFQKWVGTVYNFKVLEEKKPVLIKRPGQEAGYEDVIHKKPLEINEVVFSERRRDIPRLLRLKYLQALNPRLRRVHERVSDVMSDEEFIKDIRGFSDARKSTETTEGMKETNRALMKNLRKKRLAVGRNSWIWRNK